MEKYYRKLTSGKTVYAKCAHCAEVFIDDMPTISAPVCPDCGYPVVRNFDPREDDPTVLILRPGGENSDSYLELEIALGALSDDWSKVKCSVNGNKKYFVGFDNLSKFCKSFLRRIGDLKG